jgi:mono/diheme cytochrome c family protein
MIAFGTWRLGALAGIAACGVLLSTAAPRSAASPQIPTAATDSAAQWELLSTYCVQCHNSRAPAAGVALDALKPADIPQHAELFEKVLRKLRGRMMPPPGRPRPAEARYNAFVGWLEGVLDRAAETRPHPGRVAVHRLNRREYANAIADLFALKIDPADILPEDDRSDGFDNIAAALHTSPAFFNQYVSAARSVAVQAVGRPNPGAGSQAYFLPTEGEGKQAFHVDGLPLGTRGGFAVEHFFPADGEYEINIQNLFPGDAYFLGSEHESHLLVIVDGAKVYETKLGGGEDLKAIDQDQSPAIDAMNKRLKGIRFKTTAGPHEVAVTFLARTFAESDSRLTPLAPGGGMDRLIRITGFEVRGPFNPTGLGETPSRKRIFTCHPKAGASAAEEEKCAREILSTIAHRAYRRPLKSADTESIMEFYLPGRKAGDFDEGIRAGLTRILASPYFLYRETNPETAGAPGGGVYRLDDIELASRLSFFLWSSIPDDELLRAAESGKLREPAILRSQVQRMLADSRSRTLSRDFAYQWLQLRSIRDIVPDPNVFPFAANHRTVVGVDGDLRNELTEETLLFIDSVLREDRNVIDLLTADYSYLNERVALHYGINDIKGSRFRRAALQDSTRRGLLGKGAVLMISSYPDRTSPVRRGAWILETLLGTPPAAPPPDVEALLKDNEIGTRTFRTVRERLEAHRSQPRCNACHGILDPLGFALENFDAVGAWRTTETFAGGRVDASGELPDGTRLNGPNDLRKALLERPDQFVQTLTQKLMAYASGRTMEYKDMPAVRAIVRSAAKDEYRFSSIVMGIVQSDAFQRAAEEE